MADPSVDHGGHFGGSLALEGSTLVVGAPQDSSDRNGLVYVFERSVDNVWRRSATITHSAVNDAAFPKSFGASVSLDGDLLLIGAPRTLLALNTYDGAAYLFRRRGPARWDYITRLVRPGAADCTGGLPFLQFNNEATAEERQDAADCADLNPVQNGSFGRRVALDGELAAVTADSANVEDGTLFVGEAHIFAHDVPEDAWAHSAKLGGSLASASARFGNALALNDGAVLVGTSSTTIEARSRQGSAHLFQRTPGDDTTWHEVQTLLASDGVSEASFGAAVAFDGPRLAIGASGDGNFRGAVYLWTPTDETDDPDPTGPAFPPTGELVGDTVLVDPSGVVLGAVEGAALEPLPVWVYEVPPPSEVMLEGATPVGGYFNIGASTTTWMPSEQTFAVALPVPPTANVSRLALAALVPAETLLDSATATGKVWTLVPGTLDTENDLYVVALGGLYDQGATIALVEHPDMAQRSVGGAALRTSGASPNFEVTCYVDNCAAMLQRTLDALERAYAIYSQFFGESFLKRATYRYCPEHLYFCRAVPSVTIITGINIWTESDPTLGSPCDGAPASAAPFSRTVNICIDAAIHSPDYFDVTIAHELFHAFQYGLEKVWETQFWQTEFWILEATASAASGSISSLVDPPGSHLLRDWTEFVNNAPGLPVRRIDISLNVPKNNGTLSYEAQDFWDHLGQVEGLPVG